MGGAEEASDGTAPGSVTLLLGMPAHMKPDVFPYRFSPTWIATMPPVSSR